jgi:hypothetical protein
MILAAAAASICFAQGIAIRMEGGAFRITGWKAAGPPAEGWSSVFAVYAGAGDVPPLSGSYTVDAGELIFRPRFPLTPGLNLRAVYRPAAGAPVETTFEIPKAAPKPSTTRVSHVYPSTGVLPENQLKFYIYFSGSMQKGEAWNRIHLLDQTGKPVQLPFLEIEQELWDRDNIRLTVLFDPSRIKRGVLPLEAIGPAIENGKSYTLVIDREWPDQSGTPLVETFRKSFRAGPADRNPIDTAKWKVTSPKAGTSDALVIDFPEPLDYALLQHLIEVTGVRGKVEVDRDETEWRFTPGEPWRAADYKIVVQTTLEDLAGNHVGRAFDVDVFDKVTPRLSKETVSLSFRPYR